MNVFELVGTFAIEGVDKASQEIGSATSEAKSDFSKMGREAKEASSDVERGMGDAGSSTKEMSGEAQGSASKFSSAMEKVGSAATKAGELAVKGIGAIAGAATGAIAGLSALAGESQEYTENMTRLSTSADSAGVSQEKANETYKDFFGMLGDSDQATEATQDMLNLAQAGGDIDTWYTIAAGTVARFGDALPVENLIESANETIRTGQIVGGFADAVNWVSASSDVWNKALGDHPAAMSAFSAAVAEGMSAEDAFNAALAACSDEAERSAITQAAMAEIYGETGEAYLDATSSISAARKAQDDWTEATAAAGNAVLPVQTAVLGFGASLVEKLIPGMEQAGEGLAGMFEGKEGAAEQFSSGVTDTLTQLIQGLTDMLPTLLEVGVSVIGGLLQGIVTAAPSLIQGLASAISSMAQGISSALPTWLQSLTDLVMSLVAILPTLIPQLLDAAVTLMMAVVQAIPQVIPALVEAAVTMIETACELLPTLIPQLTEAAIALFMALVDSLPTIITALVAALPRVISAVTTALPKFSSSLMSAAKTLFMAIVSAMPQILGSLLSALGSLLSQLPGKVKSFAGSMGQAAKDMIRGMVNGIGDAAGWVTSKIKNLCSNALSAVKSFFGIRSPSRVMRKMFNYVGEGMALGLDDSEGGVLDSMQGIVEGASEIAEGFSPELSLGDAAYGVSAASQGQASGPSGGSTDVQAIGDAVYEAMKRALSDAMGSIPTLRMTMDDGSVDTLAWRLAPAMNSSLNTIYSRGVRA